MRFPGSEWRRFLLGCLASISLVVLLDLRSPYSLVAAIIVLRAFEGSSRD